MRRRKKTAEKIYKLQGTFLIVEFIKDFLEALNDRMADYLETVAETDYKSDFQAAMQLSIMMNNAFKELPKCLNYDELTAQEIKDKPGFDTVSFERLENVFERIKKDAPETVSYETIVSSLFPCAHQNFMNYVNHAHLQGYIDGRREALEEANTRGS